MSCQLDVAGSVSFGWHILMQNLRNRWVRWYIPRLVRSHECVPPQARIFVAPLFKDSRLRGESAPGYLFVDQGVRWFGGLTCDFAECFREK